SDGLGWAMAQRFAAEGARVVIADVREELAARRAEELRARDVQAVAVRADVTREEDAEAMIAAAVAEFGSVDVLCNNAGITRDAVLRKMSLDDFRLVIDVHLQGAWLCTRAAVAA